MQNEKNVRKNIAKRSAEKAAAKVAPTLKVLFIAFPKGPAYTEIVQSST